MTCLWDGPEPQMTNPEQQSTFCSTREGNIEMKN